MNTIDGVVIKDVIWSRSYFLPVSAIFGSLSLWTLMIGLLSVKVEYDGCRGRRTNSLLGFHTFPQGTIYKFTPCIVGSSVKTLQGWGQSVRCSQGIATSLTFRTSWLRFIMPHPQEMDSEFWDTCNSNQQTSRRSTISMEVLQDATRYLSAIPRSILWYARTILILCTLF